MKPELNVNFCQIIPRNSDDNVGWFFINVEHRVPDDTGSRATIKLELPVRVQPDENPPMCEPEIMQKAKDFMISAIAALTSATP